MTKEEVAKKLALIPLPTEGGMFRETYRSQLEIPKDALGANFRAARYTASTSIYYLLGADDLSKMHALSSADETWHFHCSSSRKTHIKLVVANPLTGEAKLVRLGADIAAGEVLQFTIPAGWAMGAKISTAETDPSSWALCGATVAPSYETADFFKCDAASVAASVRSTNAELAAYIASLG